MRGSCIDKHYNGVSNYWLKCNCNAAEHCNGATHYENQVLQSTVFNKFPVEVNSVYKYKINLQIIVYFKPPWIGQLIIKIIQSFIDKRLSVQTLNDSVKVLSNFLHIWTQMEFLWIKMLKIYTSLESIVKNLLSHTTGIKEKDNSMVVLIWIQWTFIS